MKLGSLATRSSGATRESDWTTLLWGRLGWWSGWASEGAVMPLLEAGRERSGLASRAALSGSRRAGARGTRAPCSSWPAWSFATSIRCLGRQRTSVMV